MDTYWWIRFRSERAQAELDQDALFDLGATGTEEESEGSSQPVSDLVIKGCFDDREAYIRAMEQFRSRAELSGGEAPREDWDQSWRAQQTPVEVTPFLTVAPPWVDPGRGFRHVIRLEAKMAFGTGSHESTRIAAMLLERLRISGRSVLDIGTGTGILAIYAALLGASQVLALDVDPVVGPCLAENLVLNPPPPACRFLTLIGETAALGKGARFHLVVCNMIRTELWPFREELRERLLPGGYFLVSGQRLEDREHFLAWKSGTSFHIAEEVELNGWWGFAAQAD